jgi:hypothetical protein
MFIVIYNHYYNYVLQQMLAAAYTAPAAAATVLRLPAVISAIDTTFQQLPEGQVSHHYYHLL